MWQSKLTDYALRIVKQQMCISDVTAAMQLHDILTHHGISVSDSHFALF